MIVDSVKIRGCGHTDSNFVEDETADLSAEVLPENSFTSSAAIDLPQTMGICPLK
jgi:hypothetical protein